MPTSLGSEAGVGVVQARAAGPHLSRRFGRSDPLMREHGSMYQILEWWGGQVGGQRFSRVSGALMGVRGGAT